MLVVRVALSYILQRHLAVSGAAAASSAPDMGAAAVWRAAVWAASGPERGLLLLALLQVMTNVMRTTRRLWETFLTDSCKQCGCPCGACPFAFAIGRRVPL